MAIPVTMATLVLSALCQAGFPGKCRVVSEVTLAFLQAEERVGYHGQEQPPSCTTVLACAGIGTEPGVRPDSTALLDEESFQSEL